MTTYVALSIICGVTLSVGANTSREIFAYLGTTPTLDGVIDPLEWNDAVKESGISGWDPEFLAVAPTHPQDLNLTLWVKHDAKRLYFGFQVIDDVLYGFQTPAWLPTGNPSANNLTQQGWPWFGDEMELLLNPGNLSGYFNTTVPGNASAWQMVCNLHKSRLGGIGVGGLLEGEPRSSQAAWDTYQSWILSGAQQAAVKAYPHEAPGGGNIYVFEWAVSFDPCLELSPGVFYTPDLPPTNMGFNIALGDTDNESASKGNEFGLRHEMWFNGTHNASIPGNQHTFLSEFGRLWLMPGPKPAEI